MGKEKVKVYHAGAYSAFRVQDDTKVRYYYLQLSDKKVDFGDTNVVLVAQHFARKFGKEEGALELLVLHPGRTRNPDMIDAIALPERDLVDFAKYLSICSSYKLGVVVTEEPIDLP